MLLSSDIVTKNKIHFKVVPALSCNGSDGVVLLAEKGLSKNKFAQRAEMQRTQLNKYMNDEVSLLSVDVLERICSVLECDISDLLVFRTDSEEEEQ